MQLQMSENIIKTHVNRRNDSVNKWQELESESTVLLNFAYNKY